MALENFALGLKVTGLGMGLVFLALLLIMLVIWLLGRLFPAQPDQEVSKEGAVVAGDVAGTIGESPVAAADEAAAVAVALALQRQQGESDGVLDEEVVGEVVMVTSIDPGSGAWRSYGRLRAMR